MSKWSVKLNLKPSFSMIHNSSLTIRLIVHLFPKRKTKAKRNLEPIDMLLTTLQFYATGTFQSVIGNLLRYSQPSVCRSIPIVSLALTMISKSQITFPADLLATICDANHRFLSECATKPGSFHDFTIFKGNGGYSNTTFLLTPYSDPIQRYEIRFNRSHTSTRCKIERAFGVLKKRFNVLQSEIRMSPTKASCITVACCVLHNIAIDRKMPLDDLEMEERDDEVAHCQYPKLEFISWAVQKDKKLLKTYLAIDFFCVVDLGNHSLYLHTHHGQIDNNEIQILS
ncbi:F14D2.9-like protein [Daphnia magna]|uniref:F14D2.9-like protein n=1 Tax=Daphnia magna TaxID=35525 RepID=A0A162RNA9_9CRUS|nr:F14D2.9-like protein [Daphnia magna]